jgi:hypothetical protein
VEKEVVAARGRTPPSRAEASGSKRAYLAGASAFAFRERLGALCGRSGSGCHPAIALACSRALALSVMPGKRRRSGQLPAGLIGLADRSSVGFGDDIHTG